MIEKIDYANTLLLSNYFFLHICLFLIVSSVVTVFKKTWMTTTDEPCFSSFSTVNE